MLPISQTYKIKLEGKFELGSQVNKIVKSLAKKLNERGGPLQLLTISNVSHDTTSLENSRTDEKHDVRTPKEEPFLREFLKSNGEKLHIYGVHHAGGTNDDKGHSNIVVRKRRRRNGVILII